MKTSVEMGLWAIHQAVAAWPEFKYEAQSTSSKVGGDGSRKLRGLDYWLQREVVMTVDAYMGSCAVSEFSCVGHVLRYGIVTKETLCPLDMEMLISKLRASHCWNLEELLWERIF